MNTVLNESVVRVLRLEMNSTEDDLHFIADTDVHFNFGGVTQSLTQSDLIIVDSTFNVRVDMDHKTASSGLILAEASEKSNINMTNCDVNYSIVFADSSYAKSPGVLGSVIQPNMTLILNVTTRLYVENTETRGSGFIATAVLGNFTVVNTTADITLYGDSRGTGFLGYVEQNGTQYSFANCGSHACHKFDGDNMTFVNYTGRSDVIGQHGTGNVAGKVNYYAYVHLINITVMGKASASDI